MFWCSGVSPGLLGGSNYNYALSLSAPSVRRHTNVFMENVYSGSCVWSFLPSGCVNYNKQDDVASVKTRMYFVCCVFLYPVSCNCFYSVLGC